MQMLRHSSLLLQTLPNALGIFLETVIHAQVLDESCDTFSYILLSQVFAVRDAQRNFKGDVGKHDGTFGTNVIDGVVPGIALISNQVPDDGRGRARYPAQQ